MISRARDPEKRKTIVVGLGNDYRGDDGAGLAALRIFRSRNVPRVTAVELRDDLTELLDHLQGVSSAYVIDAVHSDSRPGTIHRIEATGAFTSPTDFCRSTHGLSLPRLLELARLQGGLPEKLVIYGIEGARFDAGDAMTPAVVGSVAQVVDSICAELKRDAA